MINIHWSSLCLLKSFVQYLLFPLVAHSSFYLMSRLLHMFHWCFYWCTFLFISWLTYGFLFWDQSFHLILAHLWLYNWGTITVNSCILAAHFLNCALCTMLVVFFAYRPKAYYTASSEASFWGNDYFMYILFRVICETLRSNHSSFFNVNRHLKL